MRARSVKPGFFKNEILGAADPIYSLVFEGLWCLADREGRLEDRPLRIHAEINPYRPGASTVQALDWLVTSRFLVRYESGGEKYLAIVNFRKHQQPHIKEAPSKIPAPPNQEVAQAPDKHGASTEVAALTPDSPFPIPDSSLRETRAREGGRGKAGKNVPRETSDRRRAAFLRAKDSYPAGTFSDSDWVLAEREFYLRLDDGEDVADLVAAAAQFALQQQAMGRVGTQFVLSPKKFYNGTGAWRGPFPLPKPAGPTLDPAAVAAWDALVRTDGAQRDPHVESVLGSIGGWSRWKLRREGEGDRIRADFCRAFSEARA